MGLDSVMLLKEWEDRFRITISDYDAEKINTVQDSVEVISSYLKISNYDLIVRDGVYLKLKDQLFQILNRRIEFPELISNIIPETNKDAWSKIAEAIDLKIPVPVSSQSFLAETITNIFSSNKHRYNAVTIGQMADVICAANYRKLIDIDKIKSKYELYIVVMAIAVEALGVDYYEVQPYKRYTSDFGID